MQCFTMTASLSRAEYSCIFPENHLGWFSEDSEVFPSRLKVMSGAAEYANLASNRTYIVYILPPK